MISVIIPVYNTEKYITECLDSVISQTYRDLEIIIVDDGSKDSSLEKCNEYAQRDTRIKVYSKPNGGVSSARNFGIEKANGDFIAFADSDDKLKPELFDTLVKCQKKYNVDRVCGGYVHFYEDGREIYRKTRIPDGKYSTEEILAIMIDDGSLSGFMFSGVNNCLYRKAIIDRYNIRFQENIKYNEDGLFSFEYALHSTNMYSLRSLPLYMYRQHAESATHKRMKGDKYSELHQYLESLKFDKEKINFNLQMKRREVTIALWEILDIARAEKMGSAIEEINAILNQLDNTGSIRVIDARKLNRYKKFYYSLMKRKQAFILYFVTKYIFPMLSKTLSR